MFILFFCLFTDQNGNKYLYRAKKSEHMVLVWDMQELMCLWNKEIKNVMRSSILMCLFSRLIIRDWKKASRNFGPSSSQLRPDAIKINEGQIRIFPAGCADFYHFRDTVARDRIYGWQVNNNTSLVFPGE